MSLMFAGCDQAIVFSSLPWKLLLLLCGLLLSSLNSLDSIVGSGCDIQNRWPSFDLKDNNKWKIYSIQNYLIPEKN